MKLLAKLSCLLIISVASAANCSTIELKHKGKVLDPYCFTQIDGGDPGDPANKGIKVQKVDLDNCSDDSSVVKQKIERNKDGTITRYYHEKEAGKDFDEREMASYQTIGKIGYDYVISVTINGGGTGYFSTIYYVRLDNKWLYVDKALAGGDRCYGGLTDASVKNGKLFYSTNITSENYLLLANNDPNKIVGDYKNPAFDGSNLNGCRGTANYIDGELTTISLDEDSIKDAAPDPGFIYQACFDALSLNYIKSGKTELTLPELKIFTDKFNSQCVKPKLHEKKL